MKAIRFRMLTAVLTIALCSAFAVSQTARPAGHQGGGEHTLAFFTDYLDLTDAQQTQIKAILTKEKPIMAPMVQQLAATHSQLRQLEESAAFDENKARALAAQQSQTMVDLIVEKSRMKSEMFQVLTADQKTKLQKFESRHEQRFMNGLDAPPSE